MKTLMFLTQWTMFYIYRDAQKASCRPIEVQNVLKREKFETVQITLSLEIRQAVAKDVVFARAISQQVASDNCFAPNAQASN